MGNQRECTSLYIELQSIESRGITLFLEGARSCSDEVCEALEVNEESSYMRDYVFEEGVLSELHFDKIKHNETR